MDESRHKSSQIHPKASFEKSINTRSSNKHKGGQFLHWRAEIITKGEPLPNLWRLICCQSSIRRTYNQIQSFLSTKAEAFPWRINKYLCRFLQDFVASLKLVTTFDSRSSRQDPWINEILCQPHICRTLRWRPSTYCFQAQNLKQSFNRYPKIKSSRPLDQQPTHLHQIWRLN